MVPLAALALSNGSQRVCQAPEGTVCWQERGERDIAIGEYRDPQILQGMEGFDEKAKSPVLFMGATNVPWQLDPAVLRPGRFDEKVYIPLPDLAARRKMLDIYLS